jgi:anti-anti-sigma factor
MLHAPAGGAPRFLAGARSPPLGAAPVQAPIPQERLVLEPGDGLLLYTDGLVERRDAAIDARLEALRAAMASAPRDLAALLKHLTASLADDGVRTDDIALLALRTHGAPPGSLTTAIRAVAAELGALRGELREWLTATGATAGEINDILIAVGEACSNAIEHSGAGADAAIDVRARISGRELVVTVGDPGAWREATAPGHRGHGLRLMRVLSQNVKISTAQNGTRVELRFRLGAADEQTAGLEHRLPPVAALGIEHIGEVAVARVRGEVDLERVPELGSTLAASVGPRDRGLVLDLSAVDYLDSSGVHLVHQLMLTLEECGQQLRVVAAPGAPVLRVLELVGLERSVPLDASVAAAVAALARPPLDA